MGICRWMLVSLTVLSSSTYAAIVVPCRAANPSCPEVVLNTAKAFYGLGYAYDVFGVSLGSKSDTLTVAPTRDFINVSDGIANTAVLLQVNSAKAEMKVRADADTTLRLPGINRFASVTFQASFRQTFMVEASKDTEMKLAFQFDGSATGTNMLDYAWAISAGASTVGDGLSGTNLDQTWTKATNGRAISVDVKKGDSIQSIYMEIFGQVTDGGSLHFNDTFGFQVFAPADVTIYAASPADFPVFPLDNTTSDTPEPSSVGLSLLSMLAVAIVRDQTRRGADRKSGSKERGRG